MHPRIVLNTVYAHLVAGASAEDREKFDNDLYAPGTGSDLSFLDRPDPAGQE